MLALAAAAVVVVVGSSQATITPSALTVSTAGPYALVTGGSTPTLFYSAHSGSVTVTVNDTPGTAPLTVDFPDVFGDDPAPATVATHTYNWTSSDSDSGTKQVDLTDAASAIASHTFNVTPDTVPPSGQSVALSGGPGYSTLFVPLTLVNGTDNTGGSGVNPLSGVVQRASAPLTAGACGTFGAYSPVTLASGGDLTVTSGNCYRYQYSVVDNVGNVSAPSTASADAKVSATGPSVVDTAPTETNGPNDQFWNSSTDTLWFRPAATGSFTLNATATDPTTGIAQVAFPDVSAVTGWAGSTGGVDASSPYSSPVTYAWTAAAAAPGAKQVVATNGTGLTAFDTITISADSTAPTGQGVTLSGGPWFTGSVALTVPPGSDAGAGVDASRAVVERASATLTNGVCGTFGTFAAVSLSSGTDTTTASGNCYRYQAKATDNVGNVSTASVPSADAKVDKTGPTTPSLLFTGLSNTAADGTIVYFRPGGSGQFTVTAAASDTESGIASFTFPNIPGTTSVGSGPHRTYLFTNLTAPAGPFTITAQNGAGMSSSAATFSLAPDATPPNLAVRCNGAACSSAPYAKAVTIAFAATDAGGSGVGNIRWTVDGTDPKIDHGNEYQGTFSVESLTHLKARAFDKAGNPSTLLTMTVRSLANQLLFAAPATVVVAHKADHVRARMTSNRRALVRATMRGPGLKKALHWNFILPPGASIVRLRLPETLKRPGTYRVVWTAVANVRKTQRTTRVMLKG